MPTGTRQRRKGGGRRKSAPASPPAQAIPGPHISTPAPPGLVRRALEDFGKSGYLTAIIGLLSLAVGICALVVSYAQLVVAMRPPQPMAAAPSAASGLPPPPSCASPCIQYAIEVIDEETRQATPVPAIPQALRKT